MPALFVLLLFLTAANACAQGIHELAATASSSEIREAIAAGADPNARDVYGQTPLMYASDHANLQAFPPLISAGADIDARSHAGWTALMYAPGDLISGWDVAAKLLGLGADPRIVNEAGETAGDIAAREGRGDLVRLLEGGEVLYEIVDDAGLRNVLVARTPEGFFAAATIAPHDFVLARRTPRGADLMFRLQEHGGLVDHLKDLGLSGRWLISEVTLVDANRDLVPDLLFSGGCECHGYAIHALVDGATGTAYSVEAVPFGDFSLPRNAYAFPPETPAGVRQFFSGVLATEEYSYPYEEQADMVHSVRITTP